MLYMIPTKKGMGVELWGTHNDLDALYSFIGKFWDSENHLYHEGVESRDKLISVLSYDVRIAKSNRALFRTKSHFSSEKQDYCGVQISWVQLLFCLAAIKYNMKFYPTNKLDVSIILQLEYWLEKAMINYDAIGAKKLIGFIEGGIYGANEYIYHYWRIVNFDFFILGGGKRAFRQLPKLLKRGVYYTPQYLEYASYLEKEAEQFDCEVLDLEIDDDHVDYSIW